LLKKPEEIRKVQSGSGQLLLFPKGQLISKCPFGVIVSTNLLTKKFDKFCPRMGRAEFVKFFRWNFGRNDDTKGTF
jgi:hypothetical protein